MHAASSLKELSCDSWLCHYLPPLLYMSLRSYVVPHSFPSHVSTCVIFTCSQTSHVMYHVISFDLLTSHVTSHMTNSDTWLLTPTFPLWLTNTLTWLGRLPNWIARPLSYFGNTPVRNSRTWTTERHSNLTMTVPLTRHSLPNDYALFPFPEQSRRVHELDARWTCISNVNSLKVAIVPMGACNCTCCIYLKPFVYFCKTWEDALWGMVWEETKHYTPKRVRHACVDTEPRAEHTVENAAEVTMKSPSWIWQQIKISEIL